MPEAASTPACLPLRSNTTHGCLPASVIGREARSMPLSLNSSRMCLAALSCLTLDIPEPEFTTGSTLRASSCPRGLASGAQRRSASSLSRLPLPRPPFLAPDRCVRQVAAGHAFDGHFIPRQLQEQSRHPGFRRLEDGPVVVHLHRRQPRIELLCQR